MIISSKKLWIALSEKQSQYIGDWFYTDGIVQFNTFEELKEITKLLTPDEYDKRLKSKEHNYERAKAYTEKNNITGRLTSEIISYLNTY